MQITPLGKDNALRGWRKTDFLLKNVKDFDFQGILDPQLEGEHLYGAEVFPLQAAADRNCIIIIVARDHIIPIIMIVFIYFVKKMV